jgi:hypothetical protein
MAVSGVRGRGGCTRCLLTLILSLPLSLGPFLRFTGLPSRLALVAPPLRLAALRWRVTILVFERRRPPPGVSAACLVAVARFSVTRFPRIATLENVPMQPRSVCGTFSRTARPPLRPNPFSASRVRVPGTAGGESSGLGPESDRRMPGTRPSCARRQASLVREVTCSA